MLGSAAFVCVPKNARDLCPDKAEPAPNALHTGKDQESF